MKSIKLPVKVEEFSLPRNTVMDASLAIPAVKGTSKLRYGKHAYYFLNFRTLKGFSVSVSHSDIIRAGLGRFRKAISGQGNLLSSLRPLVRSYHYGFNFLEQIMLMTVPHTVTSVGEGRFIVSLWSYCGYLTVDCREKTVTYHTMGEADGDHVLGSAQWFDPHTNDLYAMSYSLKDSLERIADPCRPVSSRIFKHRIGSPATETVWCGDMADYMHDILVNDSRQYCVTCELGMYQNENRDLVPSKVLILDLKNRREWVLDRFIVAAHAQFDFQDPDVIYFSNHNFQFEHSNLFKLLKKATYAVKFRGPATVFKYRLTPDGPQEIGNFTHPDFYRLTNMHVFEHRGRKLMVAMGFPDELFLIDADNMSFIRKLYVKDPCSLRHLYSHKRALIGTISPSLDGEKLFVQTTKSFQVIDLASGKPDYERDFFFNHTCSNHMLTSSDTAWE